MEPIRKTRYDDEWERWTQSESYYQNHIAGTIWEPIYRFWNNEYKEGIMPWKDIALNLYAILDDIDTIDDWAKGNDIAYRDAVSKKQAEKNKYLFSPDGYTIKRTATNDNSN